jgi:hypothetical protein
MESASQTLPAAKQTARSSLVSPLRPDHCALAVNMLFPASDELICKR